jgi:hypothetical protein
MTLTDRIDMTVRYEILRGVGVYGELYASAPATVVCESESELKLWLSGTFYDELPAGVDLATDRLRPVAVINGVEYPCGVYIVTTLSHSVSNGVPLVTIDAYSALYLAQRAKTETRHHINAGTLYTTAIGDLLAACGITDAEITASDLAIPTAREDWDEGTPRLTIINDLLGEINYNSAWVGLDGRVRITPYTVPSPSTITHTYTAGAASLLSPDWTLSDDMYGKCNVFKVVCSNPEIDTVMTAIAENNDASSPFSIAKIGRVPYIEYVNCVPSQAVLQMKADALLYKSLQSTQEVSFATAINPTHETYETVALDCGALSGIFAETGWTLTLSPESDMQHKARRIVIV